MQFQIIASIHSLEMDCFHSQYENICIAGLNRRTGYYMHHKVNQDWAGNFKLVYLFFVFMLTCAR